MPGICVVANVNLVPIILQCSIIQQVGRSPSCCRIQALCQLPASFLELSLPPSFSELLETGKRNASPGMHPRVDNRADLHNSWDTQALASQTFWYAYIPRPLIHKDIV